MNPNDNLSPSYVSRLGNPAQSPQPIGQQHYGAAPRTPLPSGSSPRPGPGSYLLSPQPQYQPQGQYQQGYPTPGGFPTPGAFQSPKYRQPVSPPRQALAVPAVSMYQTPPPQSAPNLLRWLLVGSMLLICGLLLYSFFTKPTIVQVTMCDKSDGEICKVDSYDTHFHRIETELTQTKEDEEYLSHFWNKGSRYITVQSRLDIKNFYPNEFKNELYSLLGISRETGELEVIPVKRKLKEGNTVLEIIIEIHNDAYAEETIEEIQSLLKDNVKGIRDRHYIIPESLNLHEDEAILGGTATVKLSYGPTLTLSGGGAICQGQSSYLLFTISGGSPGRYVPSSWEVTYENINTHKRKTLKIHQWPHKEEVREPGTYRFINPLDDHLLDGDACPPLALVGEATLTSHSIPSAKLVSASSGCTTDKDFAIQLALDGTGPFSITYAIDGEEFTEEHINTGSYRLDPGRAGAYKILSVRDKFCENSQLSSIPTIQVQKGPWAALASPQQANQCLGTKTSFDFSGKVPFRMKYYHEAEGRTSMKELTLHSYQHQLAFNKSGIYHIESVTDATGCKVTEEDIGGSPFHVRPAPVAEINVRGNVCNGAKASIELKLQGTAPWTPHFTYVGEPDKKVLLDYRSEIYSSPHYVNVTEAGIFHLTRLQDAYCSNDQPLSAKVIGNPKATIEGGKFIGDGITVHVEGTQGPWNLEYFEGEQKKVVTNIQGTQYEIKAIDAVYRISKIWDNQCESNYKSMKNIVPAPFPRACASGGGTVIKGQSSKLMVDLVGTPPWTVTYAFNGQIDQRVSSKTPLVISLTEPGDFRLVSVVDSNAEGTVCSDVISVVVIEPASAHFDTGRKDVVCAGQSHENRLTVHLKGTAPWTLTYSFNDKVFTQKNIMASPFFIPIANTGEYSLLEVSDIHTSDKIRGESLTVTSKEMPTARWMTTSSDLSLCEGENLPVKMELTGSAPFTVEYTINGVKRTEVVQRSSSAKVLSTKNNIETISMTHSLVVDRDGEYRLTSLRDPYCENLDLHDTLHVKKLTPPQCSVSGGECLGDTILLDCKGQAPWNIQYTFQGKMEKSTYYDSHIEIAADKDGVYSFETVTDGTGCVSSRIVGSPVIVKTPRATLQKQGTVCEESGADLVVSLEGTAPWRLVVQKERADAVQYLEYSDIWDPQYTIRITDPEGKYSLKSVSDANCRSGVVSGGTIVKVPMARIEGGGEICKGDRTELKVHLIGTAPWSFTYQVEDPSTPHRAKTKTDIWSSPFTFLTGTEGTYRILAVNDANCRGVISNDVAVVNVHQIPTAHISGGGEICVGAEAELLVDLTGEAPWTVTYVDDEGTGYVAKDITSSPSRIKTGKPGKYTLTSVADKHCKHERRS